MSNGDYKVVIRTDKGPAGTHERTFKVLKIYEIANLIVDENVEIRDIVLTRHDTGQLNKYMKRTIRLKH